MIACTLCCPCGEQIVLPPQSPLERFFADQVLNPAPQMWPLRFVCQNCGIESCHAAGDIHRYDAETRIPNRYHGSLWRIQILCDHRRCGRRFSIYTAKPKNATREEVFYVLENAKEAVTCGESDHVFDTRMVLDYGLLAEANCVLPEGQQ
jgi:hypothetical protein